MRKNKKIILVLVVMLVLSVVFSAVPAYAAQDVNKYYLGTLFNTGKDTGYSEKNEITGNDPHFGWSIGEFYVNGYTRKTEYNGETVFLKNVGDTVTLWFKLNQDIAKLNGKDELSICADENGYDEYFGIEKTNFGKGTLIVRYTDYQNHSEEPIIYTDYLEAVSAQTADIEVKLCEEGDYEVALNYEVKKENLDIFGWSPFPSYYNYRIFFKFSVRNGDCMVYPLDAKTGSELTSGALTENGFKLDLVKSRYLNIDIKRLIRVNGAEGLGEDTFFNKPAKDGEVYTDEGIYVITVSNLYTNQTTEKKIYVGTDAVLKAHVVMGLSIGDIEKQLALGATITEDGTLILPPESTLPPVDELPTPTESPVVIQPQKDTNNYYSVYVLGSIGATLLIMIILFIIKHRKNKKATKLDVTDDNGGIEE